MKTQGDLETLKKEYEKIRKKHKLPDFNTLNKEFEIEKIQEKETDFLLREVRRVISDKVVAFLRFFEFFLNPASAPIFILTSLKNLTHKDKELIERTYRELVNIELMSISRDITYDEAREAAFIKYVMKKWQDIKPELQRVSSIILKVQPASKQKKKKYFG